MYALDNTNGKTISTGESEGYTIDSLADRVYIMKVGNRDRSRDPQNNEFELYYTWGRAAYYGRAST
jgi:hypothetical protein